MQLKVWLQSTDEYTCWKIGRKCLVALELRSDKQNDMCTLLACSNYRHMQYVAYRTTFYIALASVQFEQPVVISCCLIDIPCFSNAMYVYIEIALSNRPIL